MCIFKYRKRKTDVFYDPKVCHWSFTSYLERPTMILVNSLVLCQAPDDRRNVWLKKGSFIPEIYHNHQKNIWQWNLKWPASLSLSLSLSLGRPVIVNIRIINASTVEPKCFCCPDWRRSQIFRNSFGKNDHWLNTNIRSPLTKIEKEHLKDRKKNVYFCQPRTEKLIIQVSNIHIFFSFFLPSRMSGLVKLLIIIDWNWSWSSKIILGRVNFPSFTTTGRGISFSNVKAIYVYI